mmetsp:Transcript_37681/g.121098  ORF Transcript_37681/g.121098 Transcript_37681/m.121098 type:complete len:200 (-) Transcript_37681:85-684(-)
MGRSASMWGRPWREGPPHSRRACRPCALSLVTPGVQRAQARCGPRARPRRRRTPQHPGPGTTSQPSRRAHPKGARALAPAARQSPMPSPRQSPRAPVPRSSGGGPSALAQWPRAHARIPSAIRSHQHPACTIGRSGAGRPPRPDARKALHAWPELRKCTSVGHAARGTARLPRLAAGRKSAEASAASPGQNYSALLPRS